MKYKDMYNIFAEFENDRYEYDLNNELDEDEQYYREEFLKLCIQYVAEGYRENSRFINDSAFENGIHINELDF